jgi:hypothetical protein
VVALCQLVANPAQRSILNAVNSSLFVVGLPIRTIPNRPPLWQIPAPLEIRAVGLMPRVQTREQCRERFFRLHQTGLNARPIGVREFTLFRTLGQVKTGG